MKCVQCDYIHIHIVQLTDSFSIFIAWLQVVPLMLNTLYLSHMNMHDAQECVAVQYIPARS